MSRNSPAFQAFVADLDTREPQTNPLIGKLMKRAFALEVQAAAMCDLEYRLREADMDDAADKIAWHISELMRHCHVLRGHAARL